MELKVKPRYTMRIVCGNREKINLETSFILLNFRKYCITKHIEKLAKMELDFSALVLRKHPRSAETFSHRYNTVHA